MPLQRPELPASWIFLGVSPYYRTTFLDEHQDFQLQEFEAPWGSHYRIIATRKNLQLAYATEREKILNDWKRIQSRYLQEIKKTSMSCISDDYFRNIFKRLWKTTLHEKEAQAAHTEASENGSTKQQVDDGSNNNNNNNNSHVNGDGNDHDILITTLNGIDNTYEDTSDEFLLLPHSNESSRVLEIASRDDSTPTEVLRAIGEEGVNAIHYQDRFGRTALHVAAERGAPGIVEVLLNAGARADAKDRNGWTPLHSSLQSGDQSHIACARLLFDKGALLTVTASDGCAPLHYLVRNRKRDSFLNDNVINEFDVNEKEEPKDDCSELLETMLDKGAPVNPQNKQGNTALHEACLQSDIGLARILIKHGAKLDIKNIDGETCLHISIANRNAGLVRLLVNSGANINIEGYKGSPLQFARELMLEGIESFLVQSLLIQKALKEKASKPPSPQLSSSFFLSATTSLSSVIQSKLLSMEKKEEISDKQNGSDSDDSNNHSSEIQATGDSIIQKKEDVHRKIAEAHKRPHMFVVSNVKLGTWCSFCNGFIWSLALTKYAYQCQACNCVVHKKCHRSAILLTPCIPSPALNGAAHNEASSNVVPIANAEATRLETPLTEDAINNAISDEEAKPLETVFKNYFTLDELSTLYDNFAALDRNDDGKVTVEDLVTYNLGAIMNDNELANHFFSSFYKHNGGVITFQSYVNHMAIPLNGSVDEKLRFAFEMFERDEEGYVSFDSVKRLVESIFRVLNKMRIHLPGDPDSFVEKWIGTNTHTVEQTSEPIESTPNGAQSEAADANPLPTNVIRLNLEAFKEKTLRHIVFLQSLGLIDDDIPAHTHFQSSQRTSSRSIVFGHKHWELIQAICWGIRVSIGESYNTPRRKLKPKNFNKFADFNLANAKTDTKWIMRDYAPRVFRHLRDLWDVDSKGYMFSLGPEKILGNLLIGSFSALCEVISTSRSGSIFFKSIDNRYFIKTISVNEHFKLCEMLPRYLEHVENNPNTLLTRILGCHQIRSNNCIDFIVMENIFADERFPVHEQYDLKGSTIDRHVEVVDPAMLPAVALKDLDFQRNNRKVHLTTELKALFLEQIEKDCRFLEDFGICDYSLLIGFHFLETPVTPTSSTSSSAFKKDFGGVLSADGKAIYFMGIIDHFTTFDFRKRAESSFKSIIHDRTKISAMPPTPYRARFQKFVASILE